MTSATIILEKNMTRTVPPLNDFDAVFQQATKYSEKVVYTDYEYMVDTKEPIEVSDMVTFRLLECTRDDHGKVKNIKIELTSDDIMEIRTFIDFCKSEFIAEQNNKLGTSIYYFDHVTTSKPGVPAKSISFTKQKFESLKTFENVFFDEKKQVEARVMHFLNNKKWYRERGIPLTLGFMLVGGPGTGKTSTIKAIANVSKRHVVNVRLSDLKTNTQLKNLFQNEYLPIVNPVNDTVENFVVPIHKRLYVIDDIDCMTDLIKRRDLQSEDDEIATQGGVSLMDRIAELKGEMRRIEGNRAEDYARQAKIDEQIKMLTEKMQMDDAITLDALLNILDGTLEIPNRMFCITSNNPEIIDPALIRPGRVDMIVEYKNTSRAIIRDMFNKFYTDEFKLELFSGIRENKISPAKVYQIMFRYMDSHEAAIAELTTLSRKQNRKAGGAKRKVATRTAADASDE